MFLCSYAVDLFRYMNGSGNVTYFLFNSCCRNSREITDEKPGASVLITFDSLFQIKRYIEEAYQLCSRVYQPYFQIQFITLNVSADDLAIIQSSQVNCFRKMKIQKNQAKENLHKKQEIRCKANYRTVKMCPNFNPLMHYVPKWSDTL